MGKLVVAKFGGSAIGEDGRFIPDIIGRIRQMSADGARVVAVFSAPLTGEGGRVLSLTDVMIRQGSNAEKDVKPSLEAVRRCYGVLLEMVGPDHRQACSAVIESHLALAQEALDRAYATRRFADEVRARALAYTGELLMPQVIDYIMRGQGISSSSVPYDYWPIITDDNLEFTNFLAEESAKSLHYTAELVGSHEVVCMGGFIGKTTQGMMTTYERGGTDRTAADLGILFHRIYETSIDWEKDSAVVSADPRVVKSGLSEVHQLSYNEARLAGMFGMKILDPMAIKEILDNGVDIPLRITNMGDPSKTTVILRNPGPEEGHPIKIVTGKGNCAIMRMESRLAPDLLGSLEKRRKYREFVLLSPFVRDGVRFTRILFTDGDFVRRNERYLLGFDSLASITYNRGVVTLIGDSMWRVQYVASKTSSRIGRAGLNILNMDAQEETSRIIIIIEDAGDNLARAVQAVHDERPRITFV